MGFLVIVVVGLLVVNYFRNIDTGETLPGTTTQQTENTSPKTYTVKKGDSLWSIALGQYGSGYNWVDIRDANNLTNPNDISVGQELTIPDVASREAGTQIAEATAKPEVTAEPTVEAVATESPTPTATVKPTESPVATPKTATAVSDQEGTIHATAGSTYVVVHGDNLWNIAVAAYGNGFRWKDIADANHLANPRIIHAGNHLTIPQ